MCGSPLNYAQIPPLSLPVLFPIILIMLALWYPIIGVLPTRMHSSSYTFALHHPSVWELNPLQLWHSIQGWLSKETSSYPSWALTSHTRPYSYMHGHPLRHTWIPASHAAFPPICKSFSAYLGLTTPHHSTPWCDAFFTLLSFWPLHGPSPYVDGVLTWLMLWIPMWDHLPYITPFYPPGFNSRNQI